MNTHLEQSNNLEDKAILKRNLGYFLEVITKLSFRQDLMGNERTFLCFLARNTKN
jgi:hypothetical protein